MSPEICNYTVIFMISFKYLKFVKVLIIFSLFQCVEWSEWWCGANTQQLLYITHY